MSWKDPKTGLEWQCESPGEMTWDDALDYAGALLLNNKSNWRIPTIKELESLLDRTQYRPVMRDDVPFQDILSYWSSTTFAPDTKSAWILMFDGAYILSYAKSNKYSIRCVRGEES